MSEDPNWDRLNEYAEEFKLAGQDLVYLKAIKKEFGVLKFSELVKDQLIKFEHDKNGVVKFQELSEEGNKYQKVVKFG